jgi:hypothetical protein
VVQVRPAQQRAPPVTGPQNPPAIEHPCAALTSINKVARETNELKVKYIVNL